MTDCSILKTLRSAAEAFRLGMEAAGSEALAKATELLTEKISSWPEEALRELNLYLEKLFEAQSHKNFLYAADILQYRLLPLLQSKGSFEKGDQG